MRGSPFETSPLLSLQCAIEKGLVPLKKAVTDPTLYVAIDQANDKNRFTCFRFENGVVTAFVNFIKIEPRDGKTLFQIGYEVPEHLRGQGRAKDVVTAAIVELQTFMRFSLEIPYFIVEAIIDEENVASQHIACACISATPNPIVDAFTGRPSRQYVRHITAGDGSMLRKSAKRRRSSRHRVD